MNEDVEFLTSNLLAQAGVNHGWFMRYGGVSEGLFRSLNGKKDSGDQNARVDENRNRALGSIVPAKSQVQSTEIAHIIHEFKNNILETNVPGEFKGYDASVTLKKDVVLSQTTADCGTIIISDIEGTVVSLVHGSWHTLGSNILCDVVAKLKEHTSLELVAGIGPMICKNCYEFGPEAVDIFESKYIISKKGRYLVDLKQMIYDQLKNTGVTTIEDLNICTLEDERFFSHRRSGARSGRFLTLVGRSD